MHKQNQRGLKPIISLIVVTLAMAGVTTYSLREQGNLNIQIAVLKDKVDAIEDRVSYDSGRRLTILKMRDIILRENPKIEPDQAYYLARINMTMSEKYPSVEPALILAIQDQESKFDAGALSHKDARGLMQIIDSTALIIAKAKNISEFNLYDPETNVDFACWWIHTLWENRMKKDSGKPKEELLELILAEYNGGHKQAYYWENKRSKLYKETREYVPSVIEKYQRYKKELA